MSDQIRYKRSRINGHVANGHKSTDKGVCSTYQTVGMTVADGPVRGLDYSNPIAKPGVDPGAKHNGGGRDFNKK